MTLVHPGVHSDSRLVFAAAAGGFVEPLGRSRR